MQKDFGSKKMITRKHAAELYDCSAGHLANLFSARRGPKAYKVGRRILYKLEDLENYFAGCPILTADSAELA